MRGALLSLSLVAAIAIAGYSPSRLSASTGPIPLNCDRACLEGVMNQYLAAVAKRDPKGLPLSEDVMYTENSQVVKVGDGFWRTAEGVGNYKHIFADPEFGQVAVMTTMKEAGAPLLMSTRLRIELGRITEIEAVFFKPGGGGPNNIAAMENAKVEDIWFKSIPPPQRAPRQQMIATADAYFSGLQKNDGRGVNGTGTYPFTNDCHRIENGSPTTNVPSVEGPFALDCMGQFKMGYYFVVQAIHNRRYPLVDAERGVVWAHCVFDQGTVNSGTLSDGRAYSYRGFNRPGSILVTEAFLIDGGKIRRVEMIGPAATYHINSPFRSLTGN